MQKKPDEAPRVTIDRTWLILIFIVVFGFGLWLGEMSGSRSAQSKLERYSEIIAECDNWVKDLNRAYHEGLALQEAKKTAEPAKSASFEFRAGEALWRVECGDGKDAKCTLKGVEKSPAP